MKDGWAANDEGIISDHPDGIWFLINNENKNHYFSAIGRDIELDEGQIMYDKSLHYLGFTGTGKKATRESSTSELMLAFIRLNQGANASAVEDLNLRNPLGVNLVSREAH